MNNLRFDPILRLVAIAVLTLWPHVYAVAQDSVTEMRALPLDTPLLPLPEPGGLSPDLDGPVLGAGEQDEPAEETILTELDEPERMVLDRMMLMPPTRRILMEDFLVKSRDERGIHVYCLALPSLDGNKPRDLARTLGKRWAEGKPAYAVVIYSPETSFPIFQVGGVLPGLDPSYSTTVLREAAARGNAHQAPAEALRGMTLEVHEELEILANRVELMKEDGAVASGLDGAESGLNNLDGSSGMSAAAGMRNRIQGWRRFLWPLVIGLVGLLLFGALLWWLLRKKARARNPRTQGSGVRASDRHHGQVTNEQHRQSPRREGGYLGALPVSTSPENSVRSVASLSDQAPATLPESSAPVAGAMPMSKAMSAPVAQTTSQERGRRLPSVEPAYRLQSPYGGGNNIHIDFSSEGLKTVPSELFGGSAGFPPPDSPSSAFSDLREAPISSGSSAPVSAPLPEARPPVSLPKPKSQPSQPPSPDEFDY